MDNLKKKQELTRKAVVAFTQAVGAREYDVRAISPCGKAQSWTFKIGKLRNIDTIRTLRHWNSKGSEIYIRPMGHRYVLVDFDDDGYERLRAMVEDGVTIHYAAETSPYHVQVWVYIGRETDETRQAELSKHLAETYGGDMGATGRNKLGRLPGFFNRKPKHQRRNGHSPLVQRIPHRKGALIFKPKNPVDAPTEPIRSPLAACAARALCEKPTRRTVLSKRSDRLENIDASRKFNGPFHIYSNGELVASFPPLPDLGPVDRAYVNAAQVIVEDGHKPETTLNGEIDRSLRDLQIAKTILLCGYSEEFAVAALYHGSEKAAERSNENRLAYVGQRVSSALKFINGSKQTQYQM